MYRFNVTLKHFLRKFGEKKYKLIKPPVWRKNIEKYLTIYLTIVVFFSLQNQRFIVLHILNCVFVSKEKSSFSTWTFFSYQQ